MKINVTTIPNEGLSVRFSMPKEELSTLTCEMGQVGAAICSASIAGEVRKSRQAILFNAELETVIETECSRCLETLKLNIKTNFRHILVPETGYKGNAEEVELQEDDMDITHYVGEVIDLTPIAAEQVILQIPMKALCRESCRGLCQHCGINLNMEDCSCRQNEGIDSRLAILKGLKLKKLS